MSVTAKIEIRTFEVLDDEDKPTGIHQRGVFVNDVLFDWGMDPVSLDQAVYYCRKNPSNYKSIYGDIAANFLEYFSDFIGKPVTLKEFNDAIAAGVIEVGRVKHADN